MAADAEWIRFALSGIGAGLVAIGGSATVVFGAIGRVRKESSDAVQALRRETEAGDKALWSEIMNADHDDTEHRIENERMFATKADMNAMEDRIGRRLDQHEARGSAALHSGLQQIAVMIQNRPPVK